MKYDRAPRPLSTVSLRPPRKVAGPPQPWRPPEPAAMPASPPPREAPSREPPPESPRLSVPRSRTINGQKAVWAAIQMHLPDLQQLLHSPDQRGALAPILPILTNRGVPCREVNDAALAQVAGTHAHQGLVAILRVV